MSFNSILGFFILEKNLIKEQYWYGTGTIPTVTGSIEASFFIFCDDVTSVVAE
jgi:hypothetical protein